MDTRHNPEFTAIETYQAYGDIDDVIDQTEQIVAACAMASYGTTKFTYEGTEMMWQAHGRDSLWQKR